MVMKTGREWLLVESSKLQDRRQRNLLTVKAQKRNRKYSHL